MSDKLLAGNSSAEVPVAKATKSIQEVKAVFADLIYKYGVNFINWGDYEEKLLAAGLEMADVTEDVLKHGKRQLRDRLLAQSSSQPVASLTPGTVFKMPEGGTIARGVVVQVTDGDVSVEVERADGRKSKEWWSARAPVIPIKTKESDVGPSFPNEIHVPAIGDVAVGDSPNNESEVEMSKASTVFEMSEKQSRELLAACGVPDAENCSLKKLDRWVNRLDKIAEDGGSRPADEALGKLYDVVVGALDSGTDVEIVEGDSDAGIAESETSSNGKPAKKARKTVAKKESKSKRPGVDKGTYEREYKGKAIKVKVADDGTVHFDGKEYSSLTSVAKKITGYASINGRAFFGI